ncbi:MAG TPA: hypothetical protein VIM12_13565 [Noviherbaspirillum sp.]|jgi:hypothetical protein|uniref:hypothetical protein n=1 Tax=Noviherbaspirillum sp. TaxID=1926288 RepID=UPI002F937796
MRKKQKRNEADPDLVTAIGLVWGHVNTRRFEDAHVLAGVCRGIWPDDPALMLLQSYAAAEVLEPVDAGALDRAAQADAGLGEWARLVLVRCAGPGTAEG